MRTRAAIAAIFSVLLISAVARRAIIHVLQRRDRGDLGLLLGSFVKKSSTQTKTSTLVSVDMLD